jgi:phenylacetate-CoA ligase
VPREGAMIDKEDISLEFKQFFDVAANIKVFTAKTIKAEDGGKFRFVKSKGLAEI